MSKRSFDLCLVDPAKFAKLDYASQHAIIRLIQTAGVALNEKNELERFIDFYHGLHFADLDQAATFNFSDESTIHLPLCAENDSFWSAVNKASYRMDQQEKGTSVFYGPDILDLDFLDDYHHQNIPFPIPYRHITFFATMVNAIKLKLI
jgi:hypothetical protein